METGLALLEQIVPGSYRQRLAQPLPDPSPSLNGGGGDRETCPQNLVLIWKHFHGATKAALHPIHVWTVLGPGGSFAGYPSTQIPGPRVLAPTQPSFKNGLQSTRPRRELQAPQTSLQEGVVSEAQIRCLAPRRCPILSLLSLGKKVRDNKC